MRMWVRSLVLLSELRIRRCCELWCRSQLWLRSHVAVAGSCSSDSNPSLGTSICRRCGHKKKKKKIWPWSKRSVAFALSCWEVVYVTPEGTVFALGRGDPCCILGWELATSERCGEGLGQGMPVVLETDINIWATSQSVMPSDEAPVKTLDTQSSGVLLWVAILWMYCHMLMLEEYQVLILRGEDTMMGAPWTSSCVPVSLADVNLFPFPLINCNREWQSSPWVL